MRFKASLFIKFTDSKICLVFVFMRFVKNVGCHYNQSGEPDTMAVDAMSVDAMAVDAMAVDAMAVDAMAVDAMAVDAMAVDAMAVDAMAVDAMAVDAMAVDAMAAIYHKVDTMAAVSYHIINTYLYVHNILSQKECHVGSKTRKFEIG